MSDDIGAVENDRTSDGITVLRVTSGVPRTRAARAEQLTTRIYEVIVELNNAVARGDNTIIVDFRTEQARGDAAWTNANAYLEALRGLVQSLTLELTSPAPSINLVVSEESQSAAHDRDLTVAYLSSADGRFSRGTTYDLRSAT